MSDEAVQALIRIAEREHVCKRCGRIILSGQKFKLVPRESGKPVLIPVHIKCPTRKVFNNAGS